MNWKLLLVLGFTCVALAMSGLFHGESDDDQLELTILHTNDLHAHYDSFEPWDDVIQGGVARLKTVVDGIQDEEDDVLVLDAGDQFQGTLFFTVGGSQVVSDVMNELGYDAMCLGNHEFDAGPAELAAFIEEADFPVVSANIDASADADLANLILPYEIFEFARQDVAVFGLTSEHTATASSPGPDVQFLNAIETAQRTVDELTTAGIHVIIAVTHLGHERDLELAASVSGIDVIVGGHSHTLLDEYPIVAFSASGEPVLVVTAQEWGKRLGRLDVSFSRDGLVGGFSGEPIFIDKSIPEDEGMVGLLDEYRPAIEALMTQIVGSTDVDLNGAREDIRVRETNLGNLICDAMLWKARPLGATIAIQNGGGIRASIPVGDIAMGRVLEVLPYGNQLTVLTITGEQLIAALENGVSGIEDGAGSFPHVGGMRYTFDPAAETNSRIVSVEVWEEAADAYVDLDPAASYTLATNSYLADSGDGYSMLAEASERYDTGWLLSDVFAEFLDASGQVAPEVEGRIEEPTE